MNVKTLGNIIRQTRKEKKFTQIEAAGYLNVGTRFLSDLENGKPTIEIGKAFQVLEKLGYKILLIPKTKKKLIQKIKDELNG